MTLTSREPGPTASPTAASLPGVDSSTLTRGLYSTDASLYRVVPQGVAVPRDRAELEGLVDAALRAGVPVTLRGAGTSCAGNAVGPGVVIDLSRHLTAIHELDADHALAVVEPGVVQDVLSRRAQTVGLRFGPDPSTFTRCTIGGMIGNNACGPRALGYGRTADNVIALDVITGTGERLTVDSRLDLRTSDSPPLRALHALVMANLGLIRTQFGRFSRQVSGYSLEWLLPENGFDVAKFLTGTEGMGKALALDTPIPTPDGWTTMGTVRVGDLVLTPHGQLRALQEGSDFTRLLMLQEDIKTLPFGDVWAEYCRREGVPEDGRWFPAVEAYENNVLKKRG